MRMPAVNFVLLVCDCWPIACFGWSSGFCKFLAGIKQVTASEVVSGKFHKMDAGGDLLSPRDRSGKEVRVWDVLGRHNAQHSRQKQKEDVKGRKALKASCGLTLLFLAVVRLTLSGFCKAAKWLGLVDQTMRVANDYY